MISRRFLLALLIGVAGSIVFLWLTAVPLGIRGEWTWARLRVADADRDDVLLGALIAGLVGSVYVGLAWLGARRMEAAGGGECAVWLAGLVFAGFCWLWAVQESPADEHRMQKAAYVLYYPGSSGYFFEARYRWDNLDSFLAGYEERMAAGDVLHVGTHPPGLFLFHRGLIEWCTRNRRLTRFLLATQPESVETALAVIEQNSLHTPTPLFRQDKAALWLAALVTQFAGVVTLVPLFLLLRRHYCRGASWMAVSFWPLVPALAVFLPKSDALYPLLGTGFLYLWLEGAKQRSALLCLAAGLVFWLGMVLSLALMPVGLLALVLSVSEARTASSEDANPDWRKRLLVSIAWTGSGFVAAVLVVWIGSKVNLVNVWLWNYRNHAAFYDQPQFPRTYWKWLLVNPLELAFAAGVPVVLLAAAGCRRAASSHDPQRTSRLGLYVGCAVVGGALVAVGQEHGRSGPIMAGLSALVDLDDGSGF